MRRNSTMTPEHTQTNNANGNAPGNGAGGSPAVEVELRYIRDKVNDIAARLADQRELVKDILERCGDNGNGEAAWYDLYDDTSDY